MGPGAMSPEPADSGDKSNGNGSNRSLRVGFGLVNMIAIGPGAMSQEPADSGDKPNGSNKSLLVGIGLVNAKGNDLLANVVLT
jgi:hypothetical protein